MSKIWSYRMLSSRHYLSEYNRVATASEMRRPYSVEVPWYIGKGFISDKQTGISLLPDGAVLPEVSELRYVDRMSVGDWVVERGSGRDIRVWFRGYWLDLSFGLANGLANGVADVLAMSSTGFMRRSTFDVERGRLRGAAYLYKEKHGGSVLNYGMNGTEWKLMYRNYEFDGTCYAYMLGLAVLVLDDMLNLDAIGVVDAVLPGEKRIIMRDVLWTGNGYIQKTVMLYDTGKK